MPTNCVQGRRRKISFVPNERRRFRGRVRTHLLEKHETDTNPRPPGHSGPEAVEPGSELELHGRDESLALELGVSLENNLADVDRFRPDAEPLGLNSNVRPRQLSESAEGVEALFVTTLLGEPSRTEGHDEEKAEEDEAGDHLEEEGKSERPLRLDESRAVRDIILITARDEVSFD